MTQWAVASSALLAAVILLRALFRRRISRRLQYALWAVALVRLLVPVALFQSPASVMNAFGDVRLDSRQVYLLPVSSVPADEAPGVAVQDGRIFDANSFGYATLSEDGATVTRYAARLNAEQILGMIWAGGAAAAGLWVLGINLLFYARLKRTREGYPAEDCGLPVYVTDAVASPCLFGFPRPAVYLTPKAAQMQGGLAHVLAHERCHYRQGDHIWTLLRGLCVALWWWNPLVWVAAVLSRTDCELACDEAAIRSLGEGSRLAYGRTLVDMIATKGGPAGLLCAATTMSAAKRGIKQRLNMILRPPKSFLPAAIAVALLLAVCAGCTFTGKTAPLKTQDEPTLTAEQSPVTAGQDEAAASYGLVHVGADGAAVSAISPLSGDDAKLARDIIMDYMLKSAAWPGVDPSTLKEHYIIRQSFPGETHEYYAYIVQGEAVAGAVLQAGADGMYSRISDALYQALADYMRGIGSGEAGTPKPAQSDTLAQKQKERLAAHLTEFAEYPRGEDGFAREYSGDWDGDGKADRAYLKEVDSAAEGYPYRRYVAVEFGNGQRIEADAQELEQMSAWGSRFLLEAADLTGDGQNEILLLIDLGGQGGRGSYGLYPYARSGQGYRLMDAPRHGYELALDWKDGVATVSSGNYAEIVADADMIRSHYIAGMAETEWEAEVKGAQYHADNAADAICDLALVRQNGRTAVKISQYTVGMTGVHVDGLGYLVTTLCWDADGGCTVSDMRFVLWPQ